jgi:hypothetical protein
MVFAGARVTSISGPDDEPDVVAWLGFDDSNRALVGHRANARRIAAAVNACEGIPTEALEDGAVAGMLLTLQRTIGLDGHYYGCPAAGDRPTNCSPACNRLRAAIAEATGATP